MLSLGVPASTCTCPPLDCVCVCVCVRGTGPAPPLTLRNARPNVRLGEWLGESTARCSEGPDEYPVPAVVALLVLVLVLVLALMKPPDDQLSSLSAPARLLSAVPGRLSRPLLLLLPLLAPGTEVGAEAVYAVREMVGEVSGVGAALDEAGGARLSRSERDWALARSLEMVDGRRASCTGDEDDELLVGGAIALVLLELWLWL